MCELTAESVHAAHLAGRWIINDELAMDRKQLESKYVAIDKSGRFHLDPSGAVPDVVHSLTFFVVDERVAFVEFVVTSDDAQDAFEGLLKNALHSLQGTTEIEEPLMDLNRILFHPGIARAVENSRVLSQD